MVYSIAHSIISPLGVGSLANIEAVRAGRSGLRIYADRFADVEPFCASLFDTPQEFVPLCLRSIDDALHMVNDGNEWKELKSKQTIFILSTTKGDHLDLLTPAKAIASHYGNLNQPVVVSNACTSGVCAQITAKRLLEAGLYKYAVVVGCDIQTRFIVSGFQSFKALSPEPCLPFSPDRKGLNLGEAVATIIYSSESPADGSQPLWRLHAGSIHNDANHLSAPSRTGEGAYCCLQDVLAGINPQDVSLLGVHGTATPYNDAMEQVAIERAGLQNAPLSVLKPFFGHTMGAAGVVETIIGASMIEHGVFVKILSGFGGVNAAIRIEK